MRTITLLMVTLSLIAFIGCGSNDESSGQETETTVEAPGTDLHTAVVLNDLDAIGQHVKAGSDLNVLEPSRASTPLITAAALGKAEAAQILIEAGASLDYQNADGSTALHTAAFFCREEIVKALLEKGADKSLKNNAGMTALESAEIPFTIVKPAYEAIEQALKPAGLVLDYERLETTRPKIVEMLK